MPENSTGGTNGTSGNDVIIGTSGAESINGVGGDDTICAGVRQELVSLTLPGRRTS